MAKKHYLIKTHEWHNAVIAAVTGVVLVLIFYLGNRLFEANFLNEEAYRVITVGLLFTLNISIIVLALILSKFMLEVKDHFMDEEEEMSKKRK